MTCNWCGDDIERKERGPWQRGQMYCSSKKKKCAAAAWRARYKKEHGSSYDSDYARDQRIIRQAEESQ